MKPHPLSGAALPVPQPSDDGLDAEHYRARRRGELALQRCDRCDTWQWPPEWVCRRCGSAAVSWQVVPTVGRIKAWTRVWNPPRPDLRDSVPYLIVAVVIDGAGITLVGNVPGDQEQQVAIGQAVSGVYRTVRPNDHEPYAVIDWVPSSATTTES